MRKRKSGTKPNQSKSTASGCLRCNYVYTPGYFNDLSISSVPLPSTGLFFLAILSKTYTVKEYRGILMNRRHCAMPHIFDGTSSLPKKYTKTQGRLPIMATCVDATGAVSFVQNTPASSGVPLPAGSFRAKASKVKRATISDQTESAANGWCTSVYRPDYLADLNP